MLAARRPVSSGRRKRYRPTQIVLEWVEKCATGARDASTSYSNVFFSSTSQYTQSTIRLHLNTLLEHSIPLAQYFHRVSHAQDTESAFLSNLPPSHRSTSSGFDDHWQSSALDLCHTPRTVLCDQALQVVNFIRLRHEALHAHARSPLLCIIRHVGCHS